MNVCLPETAAAQNRPIPQQVTGALSKAVNQRIIGELPKDLTKTPTNQIASHFEKMLAV